MYNTAKKCISFNKESLNAFFKDLYSTKNNDIVIWMKNKSNEYIQLSVDKNDNVDMFTLCGDHFATYLPKVFGDVVRNSCKVFYYYIQPASWARYKN